MLNALSIAKNLKKLRADTELTQVEFAEKIGTTPSMISYIEKGKKRPSLETFVSIANEFKCSADKLLAE